MLPTTRASSDKFTFAVAVLLKQADMASEINERRALVVELEAHALHRPGAVIALLRLRPSSTPARLIASGASRSAWRAP